MKSERFEKLELKSNETSAVNGGKSIPTYTGMKQTDEFEDNNSNGKWDKGECMYICEQ